MLIPFVIFDIYNTLKYIFMFHVLVWKLHCILHSPQLAIVVFCDKACKLIHARSRNSRPQKQRHLNLDFLPVWMVSVWSFFSLQRWHARDIVTPVRPIMEVLESFLTEISSSYMTNIMFHARWKIWPITFAQNLHWTKLFTSSSRSSQLNHTVFLLWEI